MTPFAIVPRLGPAGGGGGVMSVDRAEQADGVSPQQGGCPEGYAVYDVGVGTSSVSAGVDEDEGRLGAGVKKV